MEEPLFNLSLLKSISRGNDVFVQKMLDIFCEQTPVLYARMETAFADNDLNQMGKLAHQLKPSIDNLNIVTLKQVIRKLEDAETSGANKQVIRKLLDNLNSTTNLIINKIKTEYSGQP